MKPAARSVVEEVLEAAARAFQKLRVPWYVFGAQALILRGFPRATADLDVTVLLGRIPTSRLVAALAQVGFAPQFTSDAFIAATRVLPVFHEKSRFPVDIVLGGPGLEERFAAQADRVRVGRRAIPVATSTHLVLMKVLAARPKDLEDATLLLSLRKDDVDDRELDELAIALASALDDRDVLTHLAEVRRRAERAVAPRRPEAPRARKRGRAVTSPAPPQKSKVRSKTRR